MNPVAHVAHQIHGRVRIRVPSRRGDTAYFANVYESLTAFPAIEELRVNPVAGSVIINHSDSSLDPLKQYAQEKQLFILEETDYQPEVLLQRASSGLASIDSGMKKITAGDFDLRSALFILLIAVAIRQLLRGHVVGPASTLLWQALGLVLATKVDRK